MSMARVLRIVAVASSMLLLSACGSDVRRGSVQGLLLGEEVGSTESAPSGEGEVCVRVQFRDGGPPGTYCERRSRLDRQVLSINEALSEGPSGLVVGMMDKAFSLVLVWDDGRIKVPVDEQGFFAAEIPSSFGARDLVAFDGDRVVAGCSWNPNGWACGRAKTATTTTQGG
jgi:hypothetical protein